METAPEHEQPVPGEHRPPPETVLRRPRRRNPSLAPPAPLRPPPPPPGPSRSRPLAMRLRRWFDRPIPRSPVWPSPRLTNASSPPSLPTLNRCVQEAITATFTGRRGSPTHHCVRSAWTPLEGYVYVLTYRRTINNRRTRSKMTTTHQDRTRARFSKLQSNLGIRFS